MAARSAYLLRTESQISAFRDKYARIIADRGQAVADWFNALPLYQWVPLKIRTGEEEVVIGLLCILYIDGRINITFSPDMWRIERGALSESEHQNYVEQHRCRWEPKKPE